jgi:6-phosphogluconolactonase
MSVRRDTFATEESAVGECSEFMLSVLRAALEKQETASLAVSGGLSPKPLFARMAAANFPWKRVHVFFVDERCVPPDNDQSNYKMVMEHLIGPAGVGAGQVHRIAGELDPKEAAAKYSAEIAQYFGLAAGATPEFDLVHRGMGPDAHTASLFPGDPLIADRSGIAAATYVPKFSQWRVTLLAGPLLAAKHTAVYAPGHDKADALARVFEGPFDLVNVPSQLGLREGKDERWFVTG